MNLAELIRRVRTLSNDKVEPYFWSDEEITDWLNDAVAEACVRGRLIHESANDAMCRITVTAGKTVYPIHAAMYELTHLSYQSAGTSGMCALYLASPEYLDGREPDWRSQEGTPRYAIQDDKTLRLVPAPLLDGELRLEGYRLPRNPIEDPEDEPEVNQAHHRHLVHWALHRGFSIPDMESFDPARSGRAEQEFTDYFGARPDSDLRRITREDVQHHVEPFWP